MRFTDLYVRTGDLEGKIKYAEKLGWNVLCAEGDRSGLGGIETNLTLYSTAQVSPKKPGEVQKKARDALLKADLVFVSGEDDVNRAGSECWEVDMLYDLEKDPGRDMMKQKNSGLDPVMARFMAERSIALGFLVSDLLECYGMVRSQLMGRMAQNIRVARKHDVRMVLASGAKDKFGLRAPREMISIGLALGMTLQEAKAAISKNPEALLEKSKKRNDPDILMEGLEVISWGNQDRKENKMFGFY